MRIELKILVAWVIVIALCSLFLLLPHLEIDPAGLVNASIQLLLCITCVVISRKCSGNQRYIYINFAVLFGFVTLLLLNTFMGYAFFKNTEHITVYYRIYINKVGFDFLLIFVPLFIIVDYLSPFQRAIIKYNTAIFITVCITIYLFEPFLFNPSKLYEQEEYTTLLKLKKSRQEFIAEKHRVPSGFELVQRLSSTITLQAGSDQELINLANKLNRLSLYLEEGGSRAIFWKPLNLISIYANEISSGLIILFLVLSFVLDRPYYAYIDKILIPLLFQLLLNILHNYGYIQSKSTENFDIIFRLGQYFTIFFLLISVIVFTLILRFVISPTGKYYNRVLEKTPEHVTRWRDEIDKFLIRTFLKSTSHLKQIGYKQIKTESKEEITNYPYEQNDTNGKTEKEIS